MDNSEHELDVNTKASIEAIIKRLDELGPDAVSEIARHFCFHCGDRHPKTRQCQCWNDE